MLPVLGRVKMGGVTCVETVGTVEVSAKIIGVVGVVAEIRGMAGMSVVGSLR